MEFAVGIVGTGWVAERHVAALSKIEGLRIRAIAGRNEGARGRLCASTGAMGYEDWRDMLGFEPLDAVFDLLPPQLHGEVELACAGIVPAVLVEKPAALDLGVAAAVAEAFDKAGTFAAVAYLNRCRASVLRARELFASAGDRAVIVEGRWIGGVPAPLWWRDKALSGGQFHEQCTHFVDVARFVVGEVVEVSAFAARGFVDDIEGYATDDAMTVNLRFASGSLGSFATACHGRHGLYDDGGISLAFGSRDTRVELSGWDMRLRMERRGGDDRVELETLEPEPDIFELEDRLFVRAAMEGRPALFPSSYSDALRSLAVTLAANESAASGSTLTLSPDAVGFARVPSAHRSIEKG
ncbi:MAG TPA: Gfo/Idh/MocA family oxidoreductase [Rectinemataceae bacterium]|nr:Gfo/Idh/MocA family oxidoreductase [Rectinemataceae bacterium]